MLLYLYFLADETEGGATNPSSIGIGREKDNVNLETKL